MCSKEEIKSRLSDALATLGERDRYLFESNLHEAALTHKLAVYLAGLFPLWDVDCEYNKVGSDGNPKRDALENVVRPDIIIHKRGKAGPNLLLIEAKKQDSTDDREKIEIMQNLSYSFGAFVDFNSGSPRYCLYTYATNTWDAV